MTGAEVRRRVVVRGRVQGVFFRDTVQAAARDAGVAGWVRNRGDGAVEAVFEGTPAAVERMVRLCGEGPPRARVDEVETVEEPVEGIGGFTVR